MCFNNKNLIIIIVALLILIPDIAMSSSFNDADFIRESISESIEKEIKRQNKREKRREIQQQLDDQQYRINTDVDELVEKELRKIKTYNKRNETIKNKKKTQIIMPYTTKAIESTSSNSKLRVRYLNVEFPTTPSCIYKTESNIDINIIDFKNVIVSRNNSDEYSGSIVYEIDNASSINYDKLKISLKLIDSHGNKYIALLDKMPKNEGYIKQGVSFFDKIPFDNYKLILSIN